MRLEQRLSRLEKRMGVGDSPPDPIYIYIRRFDCQASEEQIKALGDYRDWITCRRQIEAVEAEHKRMLLENPWALAPPITVTVSPRREFEARGLPIPEPQENTE